MLAAPARAQSQTADPQVVASSAILLDASDGRVLWEKNAHEPRGIASTTKIVTALIVLRKLDLASLVTASPRAEAIGSEDPLISELELTTGEQITVQNLLYGLLLPSANDAAVALAERVSGSVESFVPLMNDLARELGAKNTSFRNPHGLDEQGHHSTAADLALIALEAFRDPRFRQIVSTQQYELNRIGKPAQVLLSRNELLGKYPGANGMKTGQTLAAGRALVASATQGDESRISVVLASSNPTSDSMRLLDHGFSGFERVKLVSSQDPWGVATFGDGRSFAIVPRRTVTQLVGSGIAPSKVSFLKNRRALEISEAGRSTFVSVKLTCLRSTCSRSPDSKRTLATALWTLASPLIRAVSSLL
jgi:D-alanyl-D-alanine carboxypeptidase (penicillin-binding protein 5/6)